MTTDQLLRERLRARLVGVLKHFRRTFKDTHAPLWFLKSRPGWEMRDGPTVREAIEAVESRAERIVSATAAEIRAAAEALVSPAFLDGVLRREEVATLWPWACLYSGPAGNPVDHDCLTDPAPCDLLGELCMRCPEPLEAGDGPAQDWWMAYGDESPAELRRWAAARLEESPEALEWKPARTMSDVILEDMAREKGEPYAPTVKDTPPALKPLPGGRALSWAHVTILCHAEAAVEAVTPAAFSALALDVQRTTVRTLTSLGGAHPQDLRPQARVTRRAPVDDEEGPVELIFKWDDGEKEQLSLPFDDELGAAPLLCVSRRYGLTAIRELLGLYAFAWANRADASLFWWWPSEHLGMVGLKPTKENRRALLTRMDRLQRTQLEAHYANGRPLKGPIVTRGATNGVARQVGIHPALYGGVRKESGERGTYFWPVPPAILKLPADGEKGRVHALAVVAGSLFRARLRAGERQPARLEVRRLAAHLAVHGYQDGRARDERMGDTLRATLDAGVSCGLLGGYQVRLDGRPAELSNPDAVVSFNAGDEARAIVTTRNHPYPPHCPSTGDQLAAWLRRSRQSAAQAGRLLSLSERTVQRAAHYGARPLEKGVRDALRGHLWAATES